MTRAASLPDVLVVDDDPSVVHLMGRLLSPLATVRFAANGRDGLRIGRERVPDLILMDAEMPGMSGFQLLQEIRRDGVFRHVPVIFITSHTEAGFETSALEMGAADFIAKPFRSSVVIARVKAQLNIKRTTDELRRAAAAVAPAPSGAGAASAAPSTSSGVVP